MTCVCVCANLYAYTFIVIALKFGCIYCPNGGVKLIRALQVRLVKSVLLCVIYSKTEGQKK